MLVSAPGKIILFGEHSVVYDKIGIAGAIDRRVAVSAEPIEEGVEFVQEYPEYPSFKKTKRELLDLLKKFRNLYKEKNFEEIKKLTFMDAMAIVAAEVFDKYGYKDVKITIKLKDPVKNIGQSASIFSGIASSILKLMDKDVKKEEIARIAYLGDVIAHGGTPSGIDTNTVIYGGYVRYKKSEGFSHLNIEFEIPIIVVDSGTPSKTSVMVANVRKLKEENPKTDKVLNDMNSVAEKALKILEKKNLAELGKLMNKNHELLKKLNVSTDILDNLVNIAIKNGALGAKLTGSGGGGCIIAVAKDYDDAARLVKVFQKEGFKAFCTKLGAEGLKSDE